MAITAEDINNQSFSIDRKGYDVDEVDVFLERVAAEVDAMNARIAELEGREEPADAFAGFDTPVAVETVEETTVVVDDSNEALAEALERIADLEAQLAEKTANDNAISQALIIAQRSADDIVSGAKAEAAGIIADAENEADRIINKAELEREKVCNSIDALEDERDGLREDYGNMLRDFIADATRKLSQVSAAVPGHARAKIEEVVEETFVSSDNQEPINQNVAYAVPVAGAAVAAGPLEKDLSGFGDAEDGFAFDEVD